MDSQRVTLSIILMKHLDSQCNLLILCLFDSVFDYILSIRYLMSIWLHSSESFGFYCCDFSVAKGLEILSFTDGNSCFPLSSINLAYNLSCWCSTDSSLCRNVGITSKSDLKVLFSPFSEANGFEILYFTDGNSCLFFSIFLKQGNSSTDHDALSFRFCTDSSPWRIVGITFDWDYYFLSSQFFVAKWLGILSFTDGNSCLLISWSEKLLNRSWCWYSVFSIMYRFKPVEERRK